MSETICLCACFDAPQARISPLAGFVTATRSVVSVSFRFLSPAPASTLALGEIRRRRRGRRGEALSPSIIISHAVVRECIPGRGRGLTGTGVDSMLFPLITFIIGFKVSRPLVKSVPSVSLARRTYDSSGTLDARTRRRSPPREPYINFIEPRADHFVLCRSAPRLAFHYCSFLHREKKKEKKKTIDLGVARKQPGRISPKQLRRDVDEVE